MNYTDRNARTQSERDISLVTNILASTSFNHETEFAEQCWVGLFLAKDVDYVNASPAIDKNSNTSALRYLTVTSKLGIRNTTTLRSGEFLYSNLNAIIFSL
jgi:hypothetical protein